MDGSALEASRRGAQAFAEGRTKDAAWWAMYALELDPSQGLGWGLLGRILLAAARDALGTLSMRRALDLGLPEPERTTIEHHHRIDLWSRGLLQVGDGEPIVRTTQIAGAVETARLHPWLEGQAAEWGGEAGAREAARRLLGAFSDALLIPDAGEANPLRTKGWPESPEYQSWKSALHLAQGSETPPVQEHLHEATLLSDYWMEQEVMRLAAGGGLEQATERAELWSQLRPDQMRPLAALLRLHQATHTELTPTVQRVLALDTQDLNELEEARVALGELRLWAEQILILDRMLRQAPDHPVILANRGVANIELGQHSEGAHDLERALEQDPSNGPALANLGLERMREGRYADARALLERAKEIAPDQAAVHVYLGACKNNQGDRSGALADLEHALELEPTNDQARRLLDELRGTKSS